MFNIRLALYHIYDFRKKKKIAIYFTVISSLSVKRSCRYFRRLPKVFYGDEFLFYLRLLVALQLKDFRKNILNILAPAVYGTYIHFVFVYNCGHSRNGFFLLFFFDSNLKCFNPKININYNAIITRQNDYSFFYQRLNGKVQQKKRKKKNRMYVARLCDVS